MAADAPATETRSAGEIVAERLGMVAHNHFPASNGVAKLARVTAGATQEIWRFDLLQGGLETPLILRRAPGGGERISPSATGLEVEAELLRLAKDAGVPVPAVRHVLTQQDRMGHGYIMEFVEGETLGGRIARDPRFADVRPRLARQCGEILALIHGIPEAKAPPLKRSGPADLIAQLRGTYEATGWPRPVFELAFRWLTDNCPPATGFRLVHGDYRNGNMIFGPEGVRAILDWELAHIGDPMEDLGWICANPWRFGVTEKPVGGFGEREDLFAGYEDAGGAPVDRGRVSFWDVMGALRWGVMCSGMVGSFRSADPSVERAVIARRASENEVDLMRLLDGPSHAR